MAAHNYTLIFDWENNVGFKFKAKKDGGNPVIILQMDENAHFTDSRGQLEEICKIYFAKILKEIGDEMVV